MGRSQSVPTNFLFTCFIYIYLPHEKSSCALPSLLPHLVMIHERDWSAARSAMDKVREIHVGSCILWGWVKTNHLKNGLGEIPTTLFAPFLRYSSMVQGLTQNICHVGRHRVSVCVCLCQIPIKPQNICQTKGQVINMSAFLSTARLDVRKCMSMCVCNKQKAQNIGQIRHTSGKIQLNPHV